MTVVSRSSDRRGAARVNLAGRTADDLGYGDIGCYGAPTIRLYHE